MINSARIRKGSRKLKKIIEKDQPIHPSKKTKRRYSPKSDVRISKTKKTSRSSRKPPISEKNNSKVSNDGVHIKTNNNSNNETDSETTPHFVEEAIRSTQLFTIISPNKGSRNEKAFTIKERIDKKKGTTVKDERLKNMTWGIGLEHEMHLFHIPTSQSSTKIDGFIAFDSLEPSLELVENNKDYPLLSIPDKEHLERIPFEASGRKCHGHWVLRKIPISMPEFVTTDPFGVRGKRKMDSYVDELMQRENKFIDQLNYIPIVRQRVRRYGPIAPYPFGMSNYIKVSKPQTRMKGDKYSFERELYEDYTGSYHVTITLPFDPSKTDIADQQKFLQAHENFANQLQWLEPLLIGSFFSADQKSIGTTEKRVKGSFRVMMTGWGNLAGSDVRKFNVGVGRYADIKANWRKGLHFHGIEKLKHCDNVTIREPGAVAALSSNFRTFGSTDPSRPWHRESGVGMTMPNGIEFRIFDNFDSRSLIHLCRFIVFVAENSRIHQSDGYVYENPEWINAVQEIMKHGWKAQLTKTYVDLLRKNLGIKLKTNSLKAFDIMIAITNELYHLHRDGDWTYLMSDNLEQPLHIPQVNRRSIEYGIIMMLNLDKKFATKFYQMVYDLDSKGVKHSDFEKHLYKYLDKSKWKTSVDDVLYFGESYGFFDLKEHNGVITEVKPIKENVKNIENPTELIKALWLISDPVFYREEYLPNIRPHLLKRIHEAGIHVFGGTTHPHQKHH